ncbi:hypothetical protein CDV36_015840 [Fusarium kuroshium]|uniref:Uncharacterized protein n=1 Tax=Fusarium kuroshium TaxID=2010991 RepID=A0A3M2R5Y2_9HYPO|nr:hypothetical protein CDV36_015840 [Fusarium kuroshium]
MAFDLSPPKDLSAAEVSLPKENALDYCSWAPASNRPLPALEEKKHRHATLAIHGSLGVDCEHPIANKSALYGLINIEAAHCSRYSLAAAEQGRVRLLVDATHCCLNLV